MNQYHHGWFIYSDMSAVGTLRVEISLQLPSTLDTPFLSIGWYIVLDVEPLVIKITNILSNEGTIVKWHVTM